MTCTIEYFVLRTILNSMIGTHLNNNIFFIFRTVLAKALDEDERLYFMALANRRPPRRHRGTSLLMAARRPAEIWLTDLGGNIAAIHRHFRKGFSSSRLGISFHV